MTPEQRQEIVQIILETLSELGASVENQEEVPTITDITDEDTTMPFIQRSSGVAVGYVQISVANLANVVASKIDPAEAFPDKLDALTEEEFNAIFYSGDDSSDDSSSE
jgi:hypothetical protein